MILQQVCVLDAAGILVDAAKKKRGFGMMIDLFGEALLDVVLTCYWN